MAMSSWNQNQGHLEHSHVHQPDSAEPYKTHAIAHRLDDSAGLSFHDASFSWLVCMDAEFRASSKTRSGCCIGSPCRKQYNAAACRSTSWQLMGSSGLLASVLHLVRSI
jgi:hypothetical protein